MTVLQYLMVRATKLKGDPVSDEEWENVLQFEEDHPNLIMSPPAVTITDKMRGDIHVR